MLYSSCPKVSLKSFSQFVLKEILLDQKDDLDIMMHRRAPQFMFGVGTASPHSALHEWRDVCVQGAVAPEISPHYQRSLESKP
jgi:hypothetical protein